MLAAAARYSVHDQWGGEVSSRLSLAEQRVLAELATAPDTHAEIAERLCISQSTVSAHISSMFEKTGCKNQTQLILWGFREALKAARPVVLVVNRKKKRFKVPAAA